MIDIAKYIALCRVERGIISTAELARRLGQSSQNLSKKIRNGNLRVRELEEIANALDAHVDIRFLDNKTNKPLF